MASSPTHKNLGSLIEAENSPLYELTDQGITQTRTYHATFSVCLANRLYPGTAGGVGTPQEGYQIKNCRVESLGSEQGRLIYVWEANGSGSGATLPPDEVSVQADNQSPRVERHPIFKPLETMTVGTPAEDVLDIVENAVRAQSKLARQDEIDKLTAIPLALKLIDKLQRGQESYYMASLRYLWATHSWSVPNISRGGYRQSPLGPLANYFVGDIDWLREADDLQYSNGIWKWTSSWLGTPGGDWDMDLY